MDSLVFLSIVRIPLRCVLDLVLLEDFKNIMVSKVQSFIHRGVIPPVASTTGSSLKHLLHGDNRPAPPGFPPRFRGHACSATVAVLQARMQNHMEGLKSSDTSLTDILIMRGTEGVLWRDPVSISKRKRAFGNEV